MPQTVIIEKCENKLILARAIMHATKCPLATAANIVNNLKNNGNTILLNDGSPVNSEQWDNIVEECNSSNMELTWHYMH